MIQGGSRVSGWVQARSNDLRHTKRQLRVPAPYLLPFDALLKQSAVDSHIAATVPSANVFVLLRSRRPVGQARAALLGVGGVSRRRSSTIALSSLSQDRSQRLPEPEPRVRMAFPV